MSALTQRAPRTGDRATLTHTASGSVLTGVVRCTRDGLVLDVDGRQFDLDRIGWDVELDLDDPFAAGVIIDRFRDVWFFDGDFWGLPGSHPEHSFADLDARNGPLTLLEVAQW
jgi:hypothetical protein